MSDDCKVMITGMGMVTALGLDLASNWKNLKEGMSGVGKISIFDPDSLETQIAAEVSPEFESMADRYIARRSRSQMTRTTKLGVLAAREAIEHSGIDLNALDKSRVAVIMGVINTSYNDMEREKSTSHIIVKSMPNGPSAWVSLINGFEGPNFSISTACASSAYSIALGRQLIKSGMVDIVIAGGCDSHIEPECINGFNQILALSVRNESPKTACRPFSRSRDGFVIGEGAGVMVMEREKSARARSAVIYGEVAGAAITSEACDIVAPARDGIGMAKTMSLALADAEIPAEDIDYVNAHGTSTNLNDLYETMGIKRCFGAHAHRLCVSSTKSMLGHTIAAAGVLEGITTIMSIREGLLTPTINYEEPDPLLDLDYVPNMARDKDIKAAISNSFGFGGHNATIVYKKTV